MVWDWVGHSGNEQELDGRHSTHTKKLAEGETDEVAAAAPYKST